MDHEVASIKQKNPSLKKIKIQSVDILIAMGRNEDLERLRKALTTFMETAPKVLYITLIS